MKDEIFFNSPVQVIIPPKNEEKALVIMNSKKEKLLKCFKNEDNDDKRGSHYKESGCLHRIRILSSECLQLVPKTGCRTVEDRSIFWTKIELMNEAVQQLIRHSSNWDNLFQYNLMASSSSK